MPGFPLKNGSKSPQRPRVLVLAEMCNPTMASVPLVGYSLYRALAEVTDAHLVTQVRNTAALRDAGLAEGRDFTALDSESLARPLWRLGDKLRGGRDGGWTTAAALSGVSYYYFERLAWKAFGERIRAGQFDVVHRITPVTPSTPSPIARKCRIAGVPFVLGPINGGVPWPKEFAELRTAEREWLAPLRGLHRAMPAYAATRRSSAAILVGSRQALADLPERFRDRAIYLPENAIDPRKFDLTARPPRAPGPLRVAFVGRLVPLKGVDMLIEAAAPYLRESKLHLRIIGDGPEMPRLRDLARRERVGDALRFEGWVEHADIPGLLTEADVFAFPSIREFGGGAVLEAMALGLVPIVIAYGGPAELVTPATGFALPMGSRRELVQQMSELLGSLATDSARLAPMSRAAQRRVAEHFTWPAKAQQILRVYEWARNPASPKPAFPMPIPDPAA